jgi:hypothetical protein
MSFLSDAGKLLDWIKLPPRYLLPILIVSGFGLFAPTSLQDRFGITGFVQQFRAFIGVAFLLSFALLATATLLKLGDLLLVPVLGRMVLSRSQAQLHSLSEDEKQLLNRFLTASTRTLELPEGEGVVQALVSKDILYRSSTLGRLGPFGATSYFPYSIQPWAWDYLCKHSDLVQ